MNNKTVSVEDYEKYHMLINSALQSSLQIKSSEPSNSKEIVYSTIPINAVNDIINYFFKCENVQSIFKDFFINSLAKNDKIIAFIVDRFGDIRRTKLSSCRIFFEELFIDRESLLLNMDWEYLLVKTGYLIKCNKSHRIYILDKISEIKRFTYPKAIEGIVELIFMVRNLEPKKEYITPKIEFIDENNVEVALTIDEEEIDLNKEENIGSIAGTALGIVIEENIKLLMKEGKNPKPKEVFSSILNKKPWKYPIHNMSKGEIWWNVPTTGDIKKMTSKTFSNAVKIYKDQILGKAKK